MQICILTLCAGRRFVSMIGYLRIESVCKMIRVWKTWLAFCGFAMFALMFAVVLFRSQLSTVREDVELVQ